VDELDGTGSIHALMEIRNAYRMLVEKLGWKDQFRDLSVDVR
jgi:hypothetical protein